MSAALSLPLLETGFLNSLCSLQLVRGGCKSFLSFQHYKILFLQKINWISKMMIDFDY